MRFSVLLWEQEFIIIEMVGVSSEENNTFSEKSNNSTTSTPDVDEELAIELPTWELPSC